MPSRIAPACADCTTHHIPVIYHELGSPDAMIVSRDGRPTIIADPNIRARDLDAIRLLAAAGLVEDEQSPLLPTPRGPAEHERIPGRGVG